MELYRDQLSEKITKLTIFFFAGIVTAAMILINLKIIRHSPLQSLLSNTGGAINVFLFAALLFVLEILLIIIVIMLFIFINIMTACFKRIQEIPRTEQEQTRLGCNSRQSVALFYATQCYLYRYNKINDAGYSVILQLLSTHCAEFPLLCTNNDTPNLSDNQDCFSVFYGHMKYITIGEINTFYQCIKSTTTTQFQAYMEKWLNKHLEE